MNLSSDKRPSNLAEHLYFAAAGIVSGFVLACWTVLSHYDTTNWERFFFVIGGGTAGFLWLATIAFRGPRRFRFVRIAIVLPAAALKVIGHYAWYRLLDSRYYLGDSAVEIGLRMGLGYWLTGAIVIYGVLSIVYRREPTQQPQASYPSRLQV